MADNKLRDILTEQRDSQRLFYDIDNLTDAQKVIQTKEHILSLHRELGEVLNEIPWKSHRANNHDYDLSKIQEELIDCFKYLLNVCIIWDMDEDVLFDLFVKKSKVVRARFEAEKANIGV